MSGNEEMSPAAWWQLICDSASLWDLAGFTISVAPRLRRDSGFFPVEVNIFSKDDGRLDYLGVVMDATSPGEGIIRAMDMYQPDRDFLVAQYLRNNQIDNMQMQMHRDMFLFLNQDIPCYLYPETADNPLLSFFSFKTYP